MNFLSFVRGWIAKAERIKYPAPLLEDSATPQLTGMLVSAPYQAPEKKAKKKKGKEARGGLCHKGPSDAMFEETEVLSSHEGDEEEEEEEAESDSPLRGGRRRGRPPQTQRRRRPRGGRWPSQMVRIQRLNQSPRDFPG